MKPAYHNVRLLALSVGILILLCGCSGAGREFDTAKIQDLKKGVTTKSEIISMFGSPIRREITPMGEVWAYTYVSSRVTGAGAVGNVFVGVNQSETSCNTLEVVFDGNVLKDYRCSLSNHVDTYVQ